MDTPINGTPVNGTNGAHHALGESGIAAVPIAELELQPTLKPCCARLKGGRGWCTRPDGHEGEHDGVRGKTQPPPNHGPRRGGGR